ncbi:RNA ligase family protein [Chryseolinea sp. T2]|uniref:RNA ligase family protein n=1 Tax=Chryseolinea sp. T2 TaxID=3129255 RepID=UPI003078232D
MSISKKYGRTYHFPFSPGTTSDDRVNHNYWEDISRLSSVVHTEKLDGENNCLSRHGVFARSHAAPTVSPWSQKIREHWQQIRNDLGDIEIFGENLYAVHSIEYPRIEQYFYVFGIRQQEAWLSWDEVKFYASLFDLPTVPELSIVKPDNQPLFEQHVLALVSQASVFNSLDIATGKPCEREGVVSRDTGAFHENEFATRVFKYVRKGHVKTDEHWTRNWKRARLAWEQPETPSKN